MGWFLRHDSSHQGGFFVRLIRVLWGHGLYLCARALWSVYKACICGACKCPAYPCLCNSKARVTLTVVGGVFRQNACND